MDAVDLTVGVVHEGIARDVWRLVRQRDSFRSFRCDTPDHVWTWDRGHTYVKPLSDEMANTYGTWVEAAKEAGNRGKHLFQGWAPVEEMLPLMYLESALVMASDLPRFPRSTPTVGQSLRVNVAAAERVNISNHLCLPVDGMRDFARTLENLPGAAWLCTRWEPWSLVTVRVEPATP